ncbi:MAG TPA: hypothetical protein VN696_09365 [Pyrinomonadaceae bacterium]|nr:hypothetical protein [Pyrinomonadaceae bacterium]
MFTSTNANRTKRLVRVSLAIAMLAALLASIAPLETFASGPMCNLACCAGRAPHAAGSCMDGSCLAAIGKRANHNHHFQREVKEHLCGSSLQMRRRLSSGSRHESLIRTANQSRPAQVSSAIITKPCLLECGSCASGFSASDYRNHAAVSGRYRVQPTSVSEVANTRLALLLTPAAALRQHPPRGPPITFF